MDSDRTESQKPNTADTVTVQIQEKKILMLFSIQYSQFC